MKKYDILFTGHLCMDEIQPYQSEKIKAPGSAVLCGAVAAARTGKKIAVYTRLAEKDKHLLELLTNEGIETFTHYSPHTTLAGVVHPSENLDERKLYIYKSAGLMDFSHFPQITTSHVHLAGINNHEFSMDYIKAVKQLGTGLSVDMQSFVRQINKETCEIQFADVTSKKEIVGMMDMVKLDVVEAKILTGEDDIEKAAIHFENWGASETIITRSDGVLARVNGETYFESFSNKSSIGRTGRGDTTFAAYLSARLDHDVEYALKFAAALVSIKMETGGYFSGTLEEVNERMKT